MLSVQGKVNSLLQCPARAGSKRDFAIPRASKGSPKGLSKRAALCNTVCCLRQGGTVVTTNKVLSRLHIPTKQNPLGINQNGGGSASNFCHRLFSRSCQLFPHPVWSHKVSLLLVNDFTCVSSLNHSLYTSFYIAPHTKTSFCLFHPNISPRTVFYNAQSNRAHLFIRQM